jgi:transcriptional regulator with XRE-family HTH domain
MSRHKSLSTPRVQSGTLYFVALLREELGRRIKVARTAAGLSQQDLAEKVGLKHAQDISRYERGKVDVPSHRIDLIAEATGRTRSFFVRDPNDPEPIGEDRITGLEQKVEAVRIGQQQVLDLLSEILGDVSTPPRRRSGKR